MDRSEWFFSNRPGSRYQFPITEEDDYVCSGLLELTLGQRTKLEKFLSKVVPKPSKHPGVTSLTEHRIDVGSHKPVRQRCYVVSPRVQEAIRDEVDKMLEAGFIEPSFSEWSNPIVMVKKSNGRILSRFPKS